MHVAVLISDPAAPALEAGTAEALSRRWHGGPLRWLADGEAAEFELPQAPDPAQIADARESLAADRVDLAVLPATGRRKALLVADMDSTMIGQECIDELADMAGAGEEVRAITARAMNGELDFEAALAARVATLEGLPTAIVERVWQERIRYAPGAQALIATMRAAGAHCLLVSGGFTHFTARVAQGLGFHDARANRLEEAGGRFTGRVVPPILGRDAKVHALEEACAALGLAVGDALAVGDGANDLGMLARAGLGVALHAKPSVAAAAPVRIDHGDLTALLYLQGIARRDFERGL